MPDAVTGIFVDKAGEGKGEGRNMDKNAKKGNFKKKIKYKRSVNVLLHIKSENNQ